MTYKNYIYLDSDNVVTHFKTFDAAAVPLAIEGFECIEAPSVDVLIGHVYDAVTGLCSPPVGSRPSTSETPPYALARFRAYPSVREQLDMLWSGMDANSALRIEPFYSTLRDIKERYPKTFAENSKVVLI